MPLWSSRLLSNNSSNTSSSNGPSTTRSPPDASTPRSRPDGPASLSYLGANTVPQSATQSRPPARSFGNTIPAMLGGTKKKITTNNDCDTKQAPASSVGPRRYDENELDIVVCATCETKAKIPRAIAEYRCSICLMINDLKISTPKATICITPDGGDSILNSTLSLERTRALGVQCIKTYLKDRQAQLRPDAACMDFFPLSNYRDQQPMASKLSLSPRHAPGTCSSTQNGSPSRIPSGACAPLPSLASLNVPASSAHHAGGRRPSGRSTSVAQAAPGPVHRSNLPSIRLPPPIQPQDSVVSGSPISPYKAHAEAVATSPRSPLLETEDNTKSENKAIFRSLETYLIRTFGNFESLNAAFCLPGIKPPEPKTNKDHTQFQLSSSANEMGVPTISQLSELDAKTLLIGDIGENGLWWTGRHNNSPLPTRRMKVHTSADQLKAISQLRSPRINWLEATQWYSYVLGVGADWRNHVETSAGNVLLQGLVAEDIDTAFAEARAHVQRILLKASENLLKRPGRIIKTPDDTRFLMLLLANPLLHPGTAVKYTGKNVGTPTAEKSVRSPAALDERTIGQPRNEPLKGIPDGNSWEQGHAFGIIKRIVGLTSNLSHECHRHLTAWFSRYDEDRFRILVEVVQSLVTHRFSRQYHVRRRSTGQVITTSAMPELATDVPAELHAALGLPVQPKSAIDGRTNPPPYSDDWQVKAAARVMALLFAANRSSLHGQRVRTTDTSLSAAPTRRQHQLLPTSEFYNTMVDYSDLVADFETWQTAQGRFSFCQYPFFLSVTAKIRIMEHDARRQMLVKAREAFYNSILRNKTMEQYLVLKVRRDCLVEDSLTSIGQVVGAGQEDIKKGLKIQFVNEEGIDAGGLRKEWFLLLVREIFDPNHGMFIYDEESQLCYFNPDSFETSDQYFLVGALFGLAIYNSTILDVALPPFLFKKLLMSGPSQGGTHYAAFRHTLQYTVEDLAEYRPALARGLRQLLEFEGNVEETFCRDFVAEVSRYGSISTIPLCSDGARKPVTNANRQQFVDAYIKFLLDTHVTRQFEPFKRGFFTVCGGNALSLFQPEEIELLIRGSDEALDVPTLKAVAIYENWRRGETQIEQPGEIDLIRWFWEEFESATPQDQRRLLSFVTGSDRIPAAGAANLIMKLQFAGKDYRRFPIARTCFNSLLLYKYPTRQDLANKLWRAISDSEGFGLK